MCGLSRSGLGCAARRRDLDGESDSAPSTLGVAVARVGCVGKAVGWAVSGWSTYIEVRGAARSPFWVRPRPHASFARRQLVPVLRRRRARSLLLPFCWHPFFAFISACGWSRSHISEDVAPWTECVVFLERGWVVDAVVVCSNPPRAAQMLFTGFFFSNLLFAPIRRTLFLLLFQTSVLRRISKQSSPRNL